jgi:alpha-L-fucosidase
MTLRLICCLAMMPLGAWPQQGAKHGNDPAAVELFRDRGLGLFIHWSVDAPLGGVISHSLVGASADYTSRFFEILPRHFNPDRFQPEKWAALAKLAGFEYVMFTSKHHAGFCMWSTETTPFSVGHTHTGAI